MQTHLRDCGAAAQVVTAMTTCMTEALCDIEQSVSSEQTQKIRSEAKGKVKSMSSFGESLTQAHTKIYGSRDRSGPGQQ